MNEIFKYLHENSDQVFFSKENQLLFDFGDYVFLFTFRNNKADKDHIYTNLNDNELGGNDYSDLISFEIKSFEYLGQREDISKDNPPASLSKKLYLFILLLKKFNKNIILHYKLELHFGEDYFFCSSEPDYTFSISLNPKYIFNENFYSHLIVHLKNENLNFIPPQFYWLFYRKNKQITDSLELLILNTNSKVRRIGYLKLLAEYLKQKKVSASFINKNFEDFALKYKDELKKYRNPKGLIKQTKTGGSAKPYISLARELNLVNALNNIYSYGKSFRVYSVLKNELNQTSDNIFNLTSFDKLYFLEQILRMDYFYISSLLEIIYIKGETTYLELRDIFQNFLLVRLNDFKVQVKFEKSQKVIREIKLIEERIKKWEKPDVYLEHVLMPRINWLFDLDLLDMDVRLNVTLTNAGEKLFEHLDYWNDINCERIINPDTFLDMFMIHIYDYCYFEKVDEINKLDINNTQEKMVQYLKESFIHFSTLAPKRVTSSQAINYAKYKLYFIDKILVEYFTIVDYLNNKEQDIFIYKYQSQYKDGYIQIKGV